MSHISVWFNLMDPEHSHQVLFQKRVSEQYLLGNIFWLVCDYVHIRNGGNPVCA